MFGKILIANRGEIAARIIRTCRRMGIATVAVHSDADADGLPVRLADEAVALPGLSATDTYLDGEQIIAAALATGAEAVHPGYGFLSENTRFAQACEAAGLTFIGPGADAIAAMGDKLTAKRVAAEAGVNIIPGGAEAVVDAAAATSEADHIGYPVMLKAAAGGGGKGMRIARDAAALAEGFTLASSEAQSSFGDGRIFVEKYIEQPRHIEIQILADGFGNVIHLGERECSIQRRHQKVIEEAPSPLLDEETRAEMGAQAIALAKAVDYRSAGTVEFVANVDGDGRRQFFFLEMNTRLQVEHPVTEMTTGLDLVEWMIRIAAGEKLSIAQQDVSFDGWAIEARLYAEDPLRGFLPSIGRITKLIEPVSSNGGSGVRFDGGVVEGGDVSIHYDPMLAKLICSGPTREAAADGLTAALARTYIGGLNHNLDFLTAVCVHPRFRAGELTTDFIADEWPNGYERSRPELAAYLRLAMLAAFVHHRCIGTAVKARWVVVDEGNDVAPIFAVVALGANGGVVDTGDDAVDLVTDWLPGEPLLIGTVDGQATSVTIAPFVGREKIAYRLSDPSGAIDVLVAPAHVAPMLAAMPVKKSSGAGKFVEAPMPGLLVSLAVEPGQSLKSGEAIGVIEAMKMENVLRADRDGTVASLHVIPGDSLAVGQVIMEFE